MSITVRAAGAALLLCCFVIPDLAQAAGPANWRCTATRENKKAPGGVQCVQWTSGNSGVLAPGAVVPPPPFKTQPRVAPDSMQGQGKQNTRQKTR
jgi:hypothetical protein